MAGQADSLGAVRGRISTGRLMLLILLVLAAAVIVLNWTYGRLPAEPKPTGSFMQVDGLRIHYIEHPGKGMPVVLIHGLPGTAEDWEVVTPLLAGHRTIAIDRPGFGYSTGGYVPFNRQLETIDALLHKLHVVRPILVGHSYGGTIALGFAERYPSEVRGLVLVNAAAAGQQVDDFAASAGSLREIPAAARRPPDRQRDVRPAADHCVGQPGGRRSVSPAAGRGGASPARARDQHDPRQPRSVVRGDPGVHTA